MNTHPVVDPRAVVEPAEAQFELAVETFKLLGDVTRLKILWALLHSEHSVTELADHLGANTPAVSQQLAKLRAARLVRVRRDGNRMFYAADNEHVLGLVEQALFYTDHLVGTIAGRHDDARGTATTSGRRRQA